MNDATDRAKQIEALEEAVGVCNALEYEAVDYDPAQLQTSLEGHPRREEILGYIQARHALERVLAGLRR